MMAAPLALAKLDADSHHTVDSRFDHFKVPPTETSHVDAVTTTFHPLGDVNASQIILYAPPSADYHTDMAHSYVLVHYKVKDGEADLPVRTDAGMHLYPKSTGHALFDRYTVSLDSTDVYHNAAYAQTAFMRQMVENSYVRKIAGAMDVEGYMRDDDLCEDHDGVTGSSRLRRKKLIESSKTVCNVLRLKDPFSENRRHIPPNYAIKLTLQRAPASHFLMSDREAEAGARIVIEKLDWVVRRVKASDSLNRAHTTQLIKGHPQVLHLVKHRVRSFHIPQGVKSYRIAIQQDDYLPLKVIVGLVKHASMTGNFTLSQHHFHHFNVSSIELTVDGVPVNQRLEMDFSKGLAGEAYASFLQASGQWDSQDANGLSYEWYCTKGRTLYGFVTTTDLPNEDWTTYLHLKRKGALALNITFAEPTPEALSAQVLDTREDLLKFDAEKRIRTTDTVV